MIRFFKAKFFKALLFNPCIIFICLLFIPAVAGAVVQITDPGQAGKPVPVETVTLTLPDGTEEEAKTDEDGILYWPDGTLVEKLPEGTIISGGFVFSDVTGLITPKTGSVEPPSTTTSTPSKDTCGLPDQDHYQSISVGPNSKIGSGAKLKKKATGMLFGALNKTLGGSGISLGGGGKKKGPVTVKDPTSGDFVEFANGEGQVETRAGFTKDGLAVSTKILDCPGNGTFHAVWLEDQDGRRIFPYKYLIINIYRDWKLTVSWTYDHWTNGVHDQHREGGWVETGRDHLGSFPVNLEGEEGIKNSIWYTMGFDTAVKGIKHVGAIFALNPADLENAGRFHLVTHITQPETDPVSTIPFVSDLFAGKRENPKDDLMVFLKPHIINPMD